MDEYNSEPLTIFTVATENDAALCARYCSYFSLLYQSHWGQ